MKKILVYGSLRAGGHLHNYWIGQNPKNPISVNVPGYNMYFVGSYPIIVATPDITKTILCEEYEISEDQFAKLESMEMAAGYHTESLQGGLTNLFVVSETIANDFYAGHKDYPIKNGDYIEYTNNLNRIRDEKRGVSATN
jgi:gamma-glutamylcyclotransferase (GGCT)/AIG2-like uncharacterized protein YtfP